MDAMVAAHAKHEEEMQQHKMMIKDHDEMVKEHDELVKGHIDRTDRLSKAWKELDDKLIACKEFEDKKLQNIEFVFPWKLPSDASAKREYIGQQLRYHMIACENCDKLYRELTL